MNADRVRANVDVLAVRGLNQPLRHHPQRPRRRLSRVSDESAGARARRESSVRSVGPVGKGFMCDAKPSLLGDLEELAAGEAYENQFPIEFEDGFDHG